PVMLRLKVKRRAGPQTIDLNPTFAFAPSLQISDNPVEFRQLAGLMEAMKDEVLRVITVVTGVLGLPHPDPDSLELGDEHEPFAPENSGHLLRVRDRDGTTHPFNITTADLEQNEQPPPDERW